MPTALFLLVTLAGAPGAPSVAALNLKATTGVSADKAQLLSDVMTEELRSAGTFSRVVSMQEVEAMLGLERQRQLLNCEASSCVAELAGALGVDLVVTGTVGQLAKTAVLKLSLVDSRDGRTVASLSQQLCGQSDDALL